jgi:hypothetical protein
MRDYSELATGVRGRARRLASPMSFVIVSAAGLLALQVSVASQTTTSSVVSKPVTSRAQDPGVRVGAPGAGAALSGLTDAEAEYFRVGREDFN